MTTALSSLGIGLSLVFGCLFLALFAEIYYVLWWKKRFQLHNTAHDVDQDQQQITTTSSSPRRRRDQFQLLYLFCFRRPSSMSLSTAAVNPHEISSRNSSMIINGFHDPENQIHHDLQLQSSSSKELLLKPFGDGYGLESEIMGLHQVAGPPRFLFTIKEETKEDMELSEEGRSRSCGGRSRSLGDLLFATTHVDTPFSTPLSSPQFFTPPLTPMEYYQNNPNLALAYGFNPLFESYDAATMVKLGRSSPPPKFKFLRDAEEKLNRRIMMEAQKMHKNGGTDHHNKKEEDGSFITIIINTKNQPVSVSGTATATATQVLPNPIHSPLTNSSSRSCSNNNQ